MAVDDNGNSYVTGNFKCNLTEFSALYGIGVFNSVGFRDIFVAKFDGNGQRQWERQLGGTGDDYAAAMVINAVDKPIICGSFEKFFNAPSSSSFTTYPQNTDISNYGPNYFSSACGDGNYGDFVSVSSTGNKDVLSMMAIDLSRQPYDYYTRNGNCVRDTLMPFINQGQDTIRACGQVLLSPTLRTGADGYIGPEYEYLWSTGSTTDTIWAISTGQYILNYNYKDECRVFSDTIYVIIYPNPPGVDITSPYGPVIRATPILDCENKLLVEVGDTATLEGPQPPPGLISYWTQPNGQVVTNQNTLPAWQAGTYTYTIATPNGLCSSTNCVEVILFSNDPADGSGVCLPINFNPYIFFPGFMGTDTLRMCPRDTFTAIFADSTLYVQGQPHTIPVFGQWSNSSNVSLYYWPDGSQYTILVHKNVYSGQQTGPASITVNLIPPPGTGPPILTYTRNFYLEIYPEPPNNTTLTGDVSGLCPGDTAQIFVAGGDNYQFNGPIDVIAPDSSWFKVTTPGFYSVYSAVYDAVTGCVNRDTVLIGVDYKPAPMVTMNPFTGLICPNDSVLLTAEPGGNYFWVGPWAIPYL
ncbi:MAG: hypothetical protein M0D57_04830 [Sphingobacteriales bacterium JAD_PAG50586_3]|nr:MAG: hypothetical protein M0D57_04830 [Sphingobacteriales bacterium JAD_PAG50586_3]